MKRRNSILIATVCILFASAVAVWAESGNALSSDYEIASSEIKETEEQKNESAKSAEEVNGVTNTETAENKSGYTETTENESDEDDTEEIETADIEIASDSNYKSESAPEDVNGEKEAEKELETALKNEDFEIESNKLIKYHGSDEYVVVPDGVEIIGEGAFRGNSIIIELILPDSVVYAESEAFAYMENLVTIEKGVFFATDTGDVYEGSNKLRYYNVRDNGY